MDIEKNTSRIRGVLIMLLLAVGCAANKPAPVADNPRQPYAGISAAPIPLERVPLRGTDQFTTVTQGRRVTPEQALAATAVQPQEAAAYLAALHRFVGKNPDHVEALYRYGCLLAWGPSAREGLQYLDRAAKLRPDDDRILSACAQAILIKGNQREIARIWTDVRNAVAKGTAQPMLILVSDTLERDLGLWGGKNIDQNQLQAAARAVPQVSAAGLNFLFSPEKPKGWDTSMANWVRARDEEHRQSVAPGLFWDLLGLFFSEHDKAWNEVQAQIRVAPISDTFKATLLAGLSWGSADPPLADEAVARHTQNLEDALRLSSHSVLARTYLAWNYVLAGVWEKARAMLPEQDELDAWALSEVRRAVHPLSFAQPCLAHWDEVVLGGWRAFEEGDLMIRVIVRSVWVKSKAILLEQEGKHAEALRLLRQYQRHNRWPVVQDMLSWKDQPPSHPAANLVESLDNPKWNQLSETEREKRLKEHERWRFAWDALEEDDLALLKEAADRGDRSRLVRLAKRINREQGKRFVLGSVNFSHRLGEHNYELRATVCHKGGGTTYDPDIYVSESGLFFCSPREDSELFISHIDLYLKCGCSERLEVSCDVSDSEIVVLPTVKLLPDRPENKACVSGQVVGKAGTPLEGVLVTGQQALCGEVKSKTGANGRFLLSGLSESQLQEVGIGFTLPGETKAKLWKHTYLKRGEAVDLGVIILP